MSLATPRILPSHLHAFSPASRPSASTVRILGSITSLRGDQAVLESANHETVVLILNRDSHLSLHSTYEVVGKVITLEGGMGLGLRVLGATEWSKHPETGAPVDMRAYQAVVDATHRYKGIFYEGDSNGAEAGNGGGGGYDGGNDDSGGPAY